GRIRTLIVQGVLMTPLAAAADIILPGSAFAEKDASYANMQGRLQFTSRAIPAPGDARDDVLIVVEAARAAGAELGYASADDVRRAIAQTLPGTPGIQGIDDPDFRTPVAARHWLQASNASERVKWDTLFQDLP